MQLFTKRIGLRARVVMIAASTVVLGFLPAAKAVISLDVNPVTGDVQMVGQPGDVLSCYIITTADGANAFLTKTPTNSTLWSGTDSISAQFDANTYAAGYGDWMTMGTASSSTWTTLGNGNTVTNQLGDMCATRGTSTDLTTNPAASHVFEFTAQDSTIDLGDEYTGSVPVSDVLFAYSGTPGFMNSGIPDFWTTNPGTGLLTFASLPQTWAGDSTAGTWYPSSAGPYTGPDIAGNVVAVPEPASLGMLALGGVGLLARRRRRS